MSRSSGARTVGGPKAWRLLPFEERASTLASVFATCRQRGFCPHPFGESEDASVAEVLSSSIPAARQDPPPPSSGGGDASGAATAEESLDPLPFLGLNKQRFPIESAQSCDLPDEGYDRDSQQHCQYGSWKQIVADIAKAGGGIVRELENCDLTFRSLFGESGVIPPPADLYNDLAGSQGFEKLSNFTILTFTCALYGVRVVPTLFTLGGGSDLNDNQDDSGSKFTNQSLGDEPEKGVDVTHQSVRAARPDHQAGVIIPASGGWDTFYWSEEDVGYGASDEQEQYHRYALAVMPLDVTTDTFSYHDEATRRKALAVAAFGEALGEYFAWIEEVLSAFEMEIRDVIPYVECGNEMEVHWLDPGADVSTRRLCAREQGWFHALLAAPIHARVPSMRFRMAELASWAKDTTTTEAGNEVSVWSRRLIWLRRAIRDGLHDVRDFWRTVIDGWTFIGDGPVTLEELLAWAKTEFNVVPAAAWMWTGTIAGYHWPARDRRHGFRAKNWVHQVGFHWFHHADKTIRGDDQYQDENRLLDDINKLHLTVLKKLSSWDLTWSCSSLGFPAERPVYDEDNPPLDYNSYTNAAYQASILVRLLLTARAAGAEIAMWHTHMAHVGSQYQASWPDTWSQFTSMGIRDDTLGLGGDERPKSPRKFAQSTDAVRRPAWYSFRRLAWLLTNTSDATVNRLENGGIVIALSSSERFGAPDSTDPDTDTKYRYAYVAWLDRNSDFESSSFDLRKNSSDGYRVLSLVPQMIDSDVLPSTDENGYPTGDVADWEWNGWDAAASIEDTGDLYHVVIHRADEDDRPAPFVILSDARLEES